MKILFFGDIIGKIGRKAMAQVLPDYRKKYKPDLVMANGENLAHGSGVTIKTVEEILDSGVDFLTLGNHMADKKKWEDVFLEFENKIIRPANYPPGVAGKGYATLKVKHKRVCIINLNGRVFLQENFDDPFRKFDELEKLLKIAKDDIVLVDFHAEATSEKSAFGWYVDGRATAVLGTHTHVPTADAKILPQGTAYITDVGMVGERDSVIGVDKQGPLEMFLKQLPVKFEIAEEGVCRVNGVLVELDNSSRKVKSIKRVDSEIEV